MDDFDLTGELRELDDNQLVELVDSYQACLRLPHIRRDLALVKKLDWRINRVLSLYGRRVTLEAGRDAVATANDSEEDIPF